MMPQKRRARWSPEGFSLVETTLAIALVGVIVVAILSAFSSITIAAGRHQQQASLDRLVRSDTEFIKSQPYGPSYTDITSPGYVFANQVLYYDPATNTFAPSPPNPDQGLEEIFLRVTAPAGGVETLYFLRVRP